MRLVVGRAAVGTLRHLGSGRWQARITVKGRQVAVGAFSTRKEAAQAMARASTDAARGTWAEPGSGRQRVDSWVERWWLTKSGHRYSTRRRDRLVLDRHVLPCFGDWALGDITPADVQTWVSNLGRPCHGVSGCSTNSPEMRPSCHR